MADRLTQLQTSLDQLLTQMFATIRYIDTHHPYSLIPGQSDQNPFSSSSANPGPTNNQVTSSTQQQNSSSSDPPNASANQPSTADQPTANDGTIKPDAPLLFHARLTELAQDLVLKEQQCEVLVSSLPGLGNSQVEQERRIKALEGELERLAVEREKAAKERDELLRRVEGKILGVRRV